MYCKLYLSVVLKTPPQNILKGQRLKGFFPGIRNKSYSQNIWKFLKYSRIPIMGLNPKMKISTSVKEFSFIFLY